MSCYVNTRLQHGTTCCIKNRSVASFCTFERFMPVCSLLWNVVFVWVRSQLSLLFVACCCLIIILFITHLFFFVSQFVIHLFVKHLFFILLLMSCSSNICFFIISYIFFVYPVVYCSLNVPCLYVIYLFSAYLIILWVHLFVPPYSNIILVWFMSKVLIFCSTFVRILKVITDSLLLFSYTVGLPKPLLSAW